MRVESLLYAADLYHRLCVFGVWGCDVFVRPFVWYKLSVLKVSREGMEWEKVDSFMGSW